ncbi:MAG: lysine--tRNA ligase [Candidatus Paceibacterota bacterium]
MSLEDIRNVRIKKSELLKESGINPYPILSEIDHTIEETVEKFDDLLSKKKPITIGGRVMSLRPQGGLIFFNVYDGTAKFQGLIKKDIIKDESFDLFLNTVDIGDFVEISGSVFLTKRNEKTLEVIGWKMLSKSLRPLPEKWHGLQDVEERFRHRYLDILMNEEIKKRFILRSKIISEIRSFLEKSGYVEVETPMLQYLAGGASALPFKTHHNALDADIYLRIAPELCLKKLLIAGFPKVFEIGRNFRNEGIDVTHNPEFTMLEFYESFSSASKQMAFTEKLIKALVKKIPEEIVSTGGEKIEFSKKFNVVSYFDVLRRYALISNPENIGLDDLKLKAQQFGVKVDEGDTVAKILDNIFKKICRPKLIQPTFIVKYPAEYLPLAKRDEKDPKIVDAFQLIINGIELLKAFSELNDPIDQQERFKIQDKNKEAGDKEAQSSDEEFIEALEYGMPPAGGVGIGIDRLVMFLTNTKNIREVILFPTLKPKKETDKKEEI